MSSQPSAPARPARPISLDPSLTYIHITSPLSPSNIHLSSSPGYHLTYVGPVGELSGEHIFQVRHGAEKAGGEVVKRNDEGWKRDQEGVVSALKALEGVKGAKVMEMKQRTKREL